MGLEWSEMVRFREQIQVRYPTQWNLPLAKRASRIIRQLLRPGVRILDVGAADRRMEQWIKKYEPDAVYKSLDVDRSVTHDYYSLDDLDEEFDMITLLEVIEHLTLDDGITMLRQLRDALTEGGILVVSTPNIFNPHRFWLDATHRVAYSYAELGGILLAQGFVIDAMYRTFNAPLLEYWLRRVVLYPLHRIVNVDFAKSIVVVATNEGCYGSLWTSPGHQSN
jgi:2-polyprenyl-3-methyl-5-hydroxy-6-metoxy-1,4-benzoquinol methylase